MDFRLLGEFEVEGDAGRVRLPSRKQRALLALLLLHRGELLSRDVLIDRLWERPPADAGHALEVHVSRLRKALGEAGGGGLLASRPGGYVLEVDVEEVDLGRVERQITVGRRALAEDDAGLACDALTTALAQWRGEPLADLAFEPFAQVEVDRLEELRLGAVEDLAEARLELGRDRELVAELEPLVDRHPLRERLRGALMLALYRSGQQAAALEVYRAGRRILVDQLGIEPSTDLQQLQQKILRHDASLEPAAALPPGEPALAAAAPGRSTPAVSLLPRRLERKTVSVVFADVSGSTRLGERLDPEVLREVMLRYFDRIEAVIAEHGGTVEKFVGDAVMAIFGLPAAHEDDALRAVAAAVAIRGQLPALAEQTGVELVFRFGINSGEVVAGGGGATLATGDAINVAARLQQAAGEGEILVGALTHELVGRAVRAEPVEPLALKGKQAPTPAWRILELLPHAEALERHWETRFVGRRRELTMLRREYARVSKEQCCRLVSVVGEPGVGKTRLTREFVATVEEEALVLSGFCVPYGEGITYWPLAEIVRRLAPGGDARETLEQLAAADEEPALVAELVAGAVGAGAGVGSVGEIQWAVRRLFESLARKRPLVVVLEDLHWAEPAFLDLVEYIAGSSGGAPLLLVAVARDELLAARPSWTLPRPNSALLLLVPLPGGDTRRLLHELGAAGDELANTSGGNPLFLEQLVAFHRDDGTDASLPPTIQALLAARIDRLDPIERLVIERAAVQGATFHRAATAALLTPDEQSQAPACLLDLVRRRLIRPHRSEVAGDDGYHFVHMLVRDAVYASVPKQLRAQLHERHADWLDAKLPPERADERVGYHLEQAYRLRTELAPPDAAAQTLAHRAAERLAVPARTARDHGDANAAVALYDRACLLLPPRDLLRLELEIEAAPLIAEGKGEYERALALFRGAIQAARELGDEPLEGRATLWMHGTVLDPAEAHDAEAKMAAIDRLIALFERHRDDESQIHARIMRAAYLRDLRGNAAAAEEECRRAYDLCLASGAHAWARTALAQLAQTKLFGPATVDEALAAADAVLEAVETPLPIPTTYAWSLKATLLAMRGQFDEARVLLERATGMLEELGQHLLRSSWSQLEGWVELLADDPETAERKLRAGDEACAAAHEQEWRSTVLGQLGEALYRQGKLEQAEQVATTAATIVEPDDIDASTRLHRLEAKLAARQGRVQEAERAARDAVDRIDRTDWIAHRADARVDLAEVLTLAGRPDHARRALEEAVELYRRKGHTVGAARAQTLARDPI